MPEISKIFELSEISEIRNKFALISNNPSKNLQQYINSPVKFEMQNKFIYSQLIFD